MNYTNCWLTYPLLVDESGKALTVSSDFSGPVEHSALEELTLEELQEVSPLFTEDVYQALSLETCMGQRSSYGGPAVSETTRQIEAIEGFVKAHTK